jgi:hypothetical protein
MTFVYLSAVRDVVLNTINFQSDTFYALLAGSGYTPNQVAHEKRSSIVETTGVGYIAGGKVVSQTVVTDSGTKTIEVTFAPVSWEGLFAPAKGVVIYKRRGGAASADELVAYAAFPSVVSPNGSTLNVSFLTPLRFRLPA